jgi:hypothetical protein
METLHFSTSPYHPNWMDDAALHHPDSEELYVVLMDALIHLEPFQATNDA